MATDPSPSEVQASKIATEGALTKRDNIASFGRSLGIVCVITNVG